MAAGRRRGLLACAAGALLWTATASAQSLGLTTDAEVGFRRVIRMAQTGQLGDDDAQRPSVAIAHDRLCGGAASPSWRWHTLASLAVL
jgi:hypothetical protein